MPTKKPPSFQMRSSVSSFIDTATKSLDISDSSSVKTIPIEVIHLPRSQPRRYFEPQRLEELVTSIKQHGILQPLLVRLKETGEYELVAGERRYRAAKEALLTEVPVIIKELNDCEALQLALIENLQREDLNPVEETKGILELLMLNLSYTSIDEVKSLLYQMKRANDSQSNLDIFNQEPVQLVVLLFKQLGRQTWESFVKNRLPLLNLPEDILTVLQNGEIAYTKAKSIAQVKEVEQRKQLLNEAISDNLSLSAIKDKIKALNSSSTASENPAKQVKDVAQKIRQLKPWLKDRKKWQRIQNYTQKISGILQEIEEAT
ncbi:ParB/RepB/Spo0J family partition protein [Crocosphaera chwakensis]|uniref:ParB-like partition protein n=1 Tax=Crocosphaera chwakensis CCY0110 TaxID=391612 RepID=A3IYY0_9CHRO|nr:ParB/RepB/Spo0J family partition protein [Crocosphaera chwakensis]EAZ88320.1 ParB-like partition protein [Crocosphaera chwakensis CCY0110]